jgi:hypothetical protein
MFILPILITSILSLPAISAGKSRELNIRGIVGGVSGLFRRHGSDCDERCDDDDSECYEDCENDFDLSFSIGASFDFEDAFGLFFDVPLLAVEAGAKIVGGGVDILGLGIDTVLDVGTEILEGGVEIVGTAFETIVDAGLGFLDGLFG